MGSELHYEEWEAGIEKCLLDGMTPDEKDFAYSIKEKLYSIKNNPKPLDFDFYNCLNTMHYFFFKKPIITTPKILLGQNDSRLVVSTTLELEKSEVLFSKLEPNTVLDELFHYSVYHEYYYAKQNMTHVDMAIFINTASCDIQHVVIGSMIKMIIPEYYNNYLSIKSNPLLNSNSVLKNRLNSGNLPNLSESREIINLLISKE